MSANPQLGTLPSLSFAVHGGDKSPLVLVHAQGADSHSFDCVLKELRRHFKVLTPDCYGHGSSPHDPSLYDIISNGEALVGFIEREVGRPCVLLGHSSGGLIAAYAAGKTDLCKRLILEDPPFFSCQGERRKKAFNYVDLSSVCHEYLQRKPDEDFVLYYFENQYAWNLFPEKARRRIRPKSIEAARKFLQKHPGEDLKVPFWPKSALAAYIGMSKYDPLFGEAFYDDSFNSGIPHEDILAKIACPTLFMKAKTEWADDGILLAALDEDDLDRCLSLIPQCELVRFGCGHGIHIEKPKEFTRSVIDVSCLDL